jgi:hypothetical protein
MMNGLNILPSYTSYFTLTTATTALNTASVWLGGCLSIVYSKVPDQLGRKWGLFIGAAITILGAALQAGAQNIAMFVVGRVLIGFGTGATAIVVPVYLAETLPVEWRAWGLGLVYAAWYVGESSTFFPLINEEQPLMQRDLRWSHRLRHNLRHRKVLLNLGLATPLSPPRPLQRLLHRHPLLHTRKFPMAAIQRSNG